MAFCRHCRFSSGLQAKVKLGQLLDYTDQYEQKGTKQIRSEMDPLRLSAMVGGLSRTRSVLHVLRAVLIECEFLRSFATFAFFLMTSLVRNPFILIDCEDLRNLRNVRAMCATQNPTLI